MLLGEPQRTPYDLNFELFGFPVRVSPWFWVAGAVLGWNVTTSGGNGAERMLFLAMWILAMFLSIWLHELGHAVAMRRYGMGSYIVLYHMGGLAISSGAHGWKSSYSRTPKQQIVISVAGPAVQLILAAVIIGALWLTRYHIPFVFPAFLQDIIQPRGSQLSSLPRAGTVFAYSLLRINIFWAILNLLPIYPLDGGQIARSVFQIFDAREGIRYSLMLSVVAGACLAFWGFTEEQPFIGMMFGILAFQSYQALQSYTGGYGGRGW